MTKDVFKRIQENIEPDQELITKVLSQARKIAENSASHTNEQPMNGGMTMKSNTPVAPATLEKVRKPYLSLVLSLSSVAVIALIIGASVTFGKHTNNIETTTEGVSIFEAENDMVSKQPAAQPQADDVSKIKMSSSSTSDPIEKIVIYYDSSNERTDYNVEDFTADDNFNLSWEISDEKIIYNINSWIENFEENHISESEPIGYEVAFDRYKIISNGKEIRLNFYDATAVIIDDNYYVNTYPNDYHELLSYITQYSNYITVSANSDKWDISDEDTINNIITLLNKIIGNEQAERTGFVKGGTSPIISYDFNGQSYRVQVDPSRNVNVRVEYFDENNQRICSGYSVDKETVEELYSLIMTKLSVSDTDTP